MTKASTTFVFIALLSGSASGQAGPAGAAPKFDIADVHSSPRTTDLYMSGGILRAGRYEIRRATMLDLIRTAYGVEDGSRIQGGPGWLEIDRFDIVAKAPAAASQETAKRMLQSLLAERFKLALHAETKPMPAFVLSLGKAKPKLTPADGKSAPGCQPPPNQAPPAPNVIPQTAMLCRSMTMEEFALELRNVAGGYFDTSPVVDKTGLEGKWDFDLKWTVKMALGLAGADGISIFDAVDKQLGLKLEGQKFPTEVLVVDSVNEKPTANPPGVSTALPPPPPAEFEVADIRPSLPDATQGGRGLLPGGQIELRGYPLKILIQIAWNINDPDNMLAGAPKFLDTARFDVIAKASSITSGPASAQQVDIDDVRLMFRALLLDRFKMKVHMEDRPVPGYVLSAVKPKLTKADPSNRTGCHEGPGADGKDPRNTNPILARLMTCQNMTMAQFAEQLPAQANGYVHSEVLDATGIEGAYDFTLSFSPVGALQFVLPGQLAGGAAEPNGALSLAEAVSRQMGLKLELQKRPQPVLVIDHVEERPTDN